MHVPSDAIAAADPEWGAGLLGDKAHSMIFDNAKLRAVVPDYVRDDPVRAGRPGDRRLARRGPGAPQVDARLDAVMDDLVERHQLR